MTDPTVRKVSPFGSGLGNADIIIVFKKREGENNLRNKSEKKVYRSALGIWGKLSL